MKRKTKKILIIIALAVVFLATVALVYAYLSDLGGLENKFTVGNNSVEVEENFDPPPELKEGDNPFVKMVRITNTGNVPCYVRVFFDFSDSEVKENAKISASINDMKDLTASTWYSYEDYKEHLPEGWVYIADGPLGGCFYYTEQLKVGESTPNLFEAVNAVFKNAESVTDFEIIIVTDSVQVTDKNGEEFKGTDGKGKDAYLDAWREYLED